MKLLQKIDLFKIAVIVLLSVFLYLFNQYSKNGRYQTVDTTEILDTRTGYIYDTDMLNLKHSWYRRPVFPDDHK